MVTERNRQEIEKAEHIEANNAKRVNLANSAGTTVNPATEDKQDDIIAKMPGLEDGSAKVVVKNQHTEIIDLFAHKHFGDCTLEANTSIEDRTFNIDSLTYIPLVGDLLCLNEEVSFYQGALLEVVDNGGDTYTITVDTPLDYAFTTSAYGCLGTHNMAVDGSITPEIFSISPGDLQDGVIWDITGFTFVMCGEGVGVANEAPDDGDFGVTGVLTNGVVIRSVNGITKNIFNVKQNGEMRLRGMNIEYTDKSRAGIYSVGGSKTFNGMQFHAVTVRLESTTNDMIQAIIQDDLTEMDQMCIIVHGHVVRL